MTSSTVRGVDQVADRDRDAADAVVRHHAQLATELGRRAHDLLELAAAGESAQAGRARELLLDFVDSELLPHALAEEQTLYVTAAGHPEGALLVQGMLGEHAAIMDLVRELREARTPVHAAAWAQALLTLFEVHLAKENDLIVPLLVDDPDASLADLLDGMHELLGDDSAAEEGGCGCGGCGCGGDGTEASAATTDAPALTIDPRIDVRGIPHEHRHATVLGTLAEVAPGRAVVLVAPHAPHPLLAQIDEHFGGKFSVEWLQAGPEVWQLRLERAGD